MGYDLAVFEHFAAKKKSNMANPVALNRYELILQIADSNSIALRELFSHYRPL